MNSVGILKSTDDLESLEEREQEPDDIKDDCGKSDSDESSKKKIWSKSSSNLKAITAVTELNQIF